MAIQHLHFACWIDRCLINQTQNDDCYISWWLCTHIARAHWPPCLPVSTTGHIDSVILCTTVSLPWWKTVSSTINSQLSSSDNPSMWCMWAAMYKFRRPLGSWIWHNLWRCTGVIRLEVSNNLCCELLTVVLERIKIREIFGWATLATVV